MDRVRGEVIEAELEKGHAVVRLDDEARSLVTCELFAITDGGPVQLFAGDRIDGELRAPRAPHALRTMGDPRLRRPSAPPAADVGRVTAVLENLARAGLHVDADPAAVVEAARRSARVNGAPRPPLSCCFYHDPLGAAVHAELTFLFHSGGDAHPLDDESLVPRVSAEMEKLVQGLAVRKDPARDGVFVVSRGATTIDIAAGNGDWETPEAYFAPLVEHCNELLRAAGSDQRWHGTSDGHNWVLASRAVFDILLAAGVV